METRRVPTADGCMLHVETAGTGETVLFIHEFAGDTRSWGPQVRRFCRSYQCVTYAARGYPGSDVPTEAARYSQQLAVDDAVAVLDALETERAHVFGISMGGFTALHLAMQSPSRVRSVVAAGTGYGAHPDDEERFRSECEAIAARFDERGAAGFAREYLSGPARVQYQSKDPVGWERLVAELAEHPTEGAVRTMRGVQAQRPSLHSLAEGLAGLPMPVLILAGDEDDGCLETSLWLKRTIRTAGLAILPKSGHTLNLEEPDSINLIVADFWSRVHTDSWGTRDARARPGSITGISS